MDSTDGTILVTGGAGFIGFHLVQRLVDEGHRVVVLDSEFRGSADGLTELPGVRHIGGDIRDRTEFPDSSLEVDIVYHLAAINGTKNFYEMPQHVLDVNVNGTQNAIEFALDRDAHRFVFASSSEVYGFPREFPTSEEHPLQIMDPENPRFSYAGSKAVGELFTINATRGSPMEYTILRPHNVYGPRMGYDHVIPEFIERLVGGDEFTIYGTGKQSRCFCYVDDAVDAFLQAGVSHEAANEIFNVGDDRFEVSINDLAELLFDITGNRPPVEHIESRELEGSTERRVPDISRARGRLEFQPAVTLEEGLRRTYEWYREELS